jgi:hypothetical protein
VALLGCSGLLGDIIEQTVAAQPDLCVVADLATSDLNGTLPELDADIVLWNNADETRIAAWLGVLSARRLPRVLATIGDGRDASLWELTPRRTELGALSPASLVETIRRTAGEQQ